MGGGGGGGGGGELAAAARVHLLAMPTEFGTSLCVIIIPPWHIGWYRIWWAWLAGELGRRRRAAVVPTNHETIVSLSFHQSMILGTIPVSLV
jgi:hypothetical protein